MNVENLQKEFDEIINGANQDLIQENANTDGKSPMGVMGLFASSASKEYAMDLLDDDVREAFEKGYIHIHDFDFYATGTTTCCQIPLGDMLSKGFKIGHCYIRSPKSIMSAMALASILIQANQNQQHGGQSYPNYDYDLAPYVKLSFEKQKKNLSELNVGLTDVQIENIAWENTKKETFQAAESFVHNANSMLTRNGIQVPFVSINFGLDTSKYGRLVSESMLKAQMAGLGDGDTPLFPILVFKIKEGINFNKTDPNYDLYQLSLECLSKRLFPNFQFVDTPFNSVGFDINDKNTHIATMGCRTRVFGDVSGVNSVEGRGNLSFTTINLPMIAYKSKDIDEFYKNLKYHLDLVTRQLLQRYEYQQNRSASSFKLLYEQGVWKDSEKIAEDGKVGEAIKTGTLSAGFIGLAETLLLLTGKHHGESVEAQQLGLEIIKYMRDEMDKAMDEYNLNFSLLATPAEGYSGKSVRKFVKEFGEVENITDKGYFTNSNHVPVYYNISAKKKIEIEAPYHELTNAGHIMYVELDGDASANTEALDDVVREMFDKNVGYGSINHPIDRCNNCGLQTIIEHVCPRCGSENINRIRRITGYLVGSMEKWNEGKQKEEVQRVKHGSD